MVEAKANWHSGIRSRAGEAVSEGFYRSEPQPVGDDGITVRYLSVTGDNPAGLPQGVYIETNITPDSYNADMVLRSSIRSHVCLELMDNAPSVGQSPQSDSPRLDYDNAISFSQAFVTRAGALVLQLFPSDREEVDRHIQGVESGEYRMKFMPPKP
ncbi:MAG: hypothetical protein Q7S45_00690 [Candidatus Curtissbacteria bacterium]|nr:hypothetical protein [Candidatus Curtissbacteria bacterium]